MGKGTAGARTHKAGVSRWEREDPKFGPERHSTKKASKELAGVTIVNEFGRDEDMFDMARRFRRDLETRHELRDEGTGGNWRP